MSLKSQLSSHCCIGRYYNIGRYTLLQTAYHKLSVDIDLKNFIMAFSMDN